MAKNRLIAKQILGLGLTLLTLDPCLRQHLKSRCFDTSVLEAYEPNDKEDGL
jgi:hypothetical protein